MPNLALLLLLQHFRNLIKSFFTHAFLSILTPLNATQRVIIHSEAAVITVYFAVIGKEFDFFATLWTSFILNRGSANISSSWAIVNDLHDTVTSETRKDQA